MRQGPIFRWALTVIVPIGLSAIVMTGCRSVETVRPEPKSVARLWNEAVLEAIRNDFAKPTSHARNLYHLSVAMWDAWAAFDQAAIQVVSEERGGRRLGNAATARARNEAISYAAYRVLRSRYRNSPGAIETIPRFDALLAQLGYDGSVTTTTGTSPAALGNRIAQRMLEYGATDGAAEEPGDIRLGPEYRPINPPLVVAEPGTGELVDPNRWQPLKLTISIDQAGRELPGGVQLYLGPHWGSVLPFALSSRSPATGQANLYHDPGPPPQLDGDSVALYQEVFLEVARYGSMQTPDDGVLIDISPASHGANTLGANDGTGYAVNPGTGSPYPANVVKRGDWARVIAEFWADGPDSETPPGHWNVLANYVTDHPQTKRRFEGAGPGFDALEWDVKLYLVLNGALHDAAITAWGIKAHYDYVRPITAIRHMASLGQSSDPDAPAFHRLGLPLEDGLVAVITSESSAAGGPHEHLADFVGEIAVYGWLGQPEEPDVEYSGVGWIRGVEWLTYQRATFVTPPFAGYISGHSTFSRAGAEVMARFTGSVYFPGGLGEFVAPANNYLVFESGPSETVTLQWATYYDAADEAGISRLYGGIHPRIDDLPGRLIGAEVGIDAFLKAKSYFSGQM